jgi:DNA invertase Pin-like site-specific DNA recombinase
MPRRPSARAAGAPSAPTFVSYLRVSTDAQGESGIGLEAQRQAIERHVAQAGGKVVAEYREVESGKRNDRPEMAKAIAACRARRATLIIAKLDRLARNVYFVSSLMEAGIEFVACDNPHATKLTIHILAAVAENEREMISRRTMDGLDVVKRHIAEHGYWISRRSGRRISRLGNETPHAGNRAAAKAASQAASAKARQRAADIMPYIEQIRRAGIYTLGGIAEALTARGIKTPGGCAQWSAEQVRRIIGRAAGLGAE